MKTIDRPTGIVRIILVEVDGTEQVLEIDEDVHYILGFSKVGPNGGKNLPMEIIVKGSTSVVGEIFFRLGEAYPELLDICARKVMAKTAERLRARGIDPGLEEFKRARPVGGVQ